MENLQEKPMSISDAVFVINQLISECGAMGANDHEISTLMALIDQVHSGEITPEAGAQQAREIRYSKQDYH